MKNLVLKVVLVIVLVFAVNMTVLSAEEYSFTVVRGSIGGTWDPFGNPPDAFVSIVSRRAGYIQQTGIVRDSYNPRWDFSSSVNDKTLNFTVYDKDVSENDYIGNSGDIDLADIGVGNTKQIRCGQATIWVRRDS